MGHTELSELEMTSNPFHPSKVVLLNNWQKELLEMKCNSITKGNF